MKREILKVKNLLPLENIIIMTTINIKKYLAAGLLLCGLTVGMSSCEDMLETESSRQVFDPELNQKTDSIFYALGILQGMQELADQYVFQGEMRGDLVQTTPYTDNNLRYLANFSANTTNKYDSAYVYYRVINNCNYYIAHVDTTLRTGSSYVMMNEYVAVKALRAWTYMQLARVYGSVPFYTEPLTQISQIDNNRYPELDMAGIVSALAGDLEQYTTGDKLYPVPDYGNTPQYANFDPSYIFFPVDVVLGEMYLETGQYDKAANHYIHYLTRLAQTTHSAYMQPYMPGNRMLRLDDLPSDMDPSNLSFSKAYSRWDVIFSGYNDFVTYIPMNASSLQGATTMLPVTYGYDFYATDKTGNSRYIDERQLEASESYLNLVNSTDFYYLSTTSTTSNRVINIAPLGDTRYKSVIHEDEDAETDSVKVWITKFNNARIPIYRTSTVLLHLAEAFNRLGMPDAAFAILKDGINEYLVREDGGAAYITPETRLALTTTYPLLSEANRSKFAESYNAYGIHMHGSGYASDYDVDNNVYTPGLSPYQLDTIVGLKMLEIQNTFGVAVGTTKQDSINAVEDILCDEYALEFAFEGTRFYDLCRLARHKNGHASSTSSFDGSPATYGANYGGRWIARKLAFKNPVVNLEEPSNWYLPFK